MLASPLSTNSYKQSARSDLVNRQFDCPPGANCGHGPECVPSLCDLPGCKDAEVCQDSQVQKRNAATTLLDRQIACPEGLHCGPGPVCTPATCDLEGCADADVCQDHQKRKRNAETDIIHPVCDICIIGDNGVRVCGCAAPGGGKGKMRRDTERVCPLFCITTKKGQTLCGCAAQDYEKSGNGN